MADTQDTSYGRTSPVRSAPTKEKTSKPSSKRSSGSRNRAPRCLCLRKTSGPTPTYTWESNGALRTALLTRNTGEFPSEDAASTLSLSLIHIFISLLHLRAPIYADTAAYGHFNGYKYSWENLDKTDELRKAVEKYAD